MDSFNKQADQFHPEIIFNQQTGQLSIKGKSIPLNADKFLSDIISWVEQYSHEPQDKTNLEIDLNYMNGNSVRSLLAILYQMKNISDTGRYVKVNWSVPSDADDMIEFSKEILSSLNIPHDIRLN
ncbi:DUF1987 domain-containing protein [Salibacteraceae bacterium]|nr:DUF1987 domain-containing protein [Salibacteraceae bacterium]